MGLILLSQLWQPDEQSSSSAPTEELDAYVKGLETQMGTMISVIDGVGKCEVMVTLENGMEYLYESHSQIVTEIFPSVKGVVVVCEGADDPAVCDRITEVVTTAFNITKRRVCVTKLS